MKAWLCTLLALPLIVSAADPSVQNGGKHEADTTALVSTPTAPRHIEVEIVHVVAGTGAVVKGGYYDYAPGDAIPAGKVTVKGITMPAIQQRWQSLPNPVFIRGLTGDLRDGADWEGMLEPDGTYTYRVPFQEPKTIPAFKLSTAADPVAAFRATAKR